MTPQMLKSQHLPEFDFFSSKELINLQNELHAQNNQNLIKAHNDSHSEHLNQHNNALSD